MTGGVASDRLVLPATVLEQAQGWFEQQGAHGHEGTALIARGPGRVRLVVPEQRASRMRLGASVEVTRAGQLQLATALGSGELFVARIHSHPDKAFPQRCGRRQSRAHARRCPVDRRAVLRPGASSRLGRLRRAALRLRTVARPAARATP